MTDPTPRFTVYRAAVAAVQELAPRFVRITLGGGGLADYECEGLAPKVKLFLPSGPGSPAIPEVGMSGSVYPPGAPIPVVRTYTVSAHRPQRNPGLGGRCETLRNALAFRGRFAGRH